MLEAKATTVARQALLSASFSSLAMAHTFSRDHTANPFDTPTTDECRQLCWQVADPPRETTQQHPPTLTRRQLAQQPQLRSCSHPFDTQLQIGQSY